MSSVEKLADLLKAISAGSMDIKPSARVQGSALQKENLSAVINKVTFEDKHMKLQKMLEVETCKSTLVSFNRQLSTGEFGAAAQLEGLIGEPNTGDYVQLAVPMCYYSKWCMTTLAADMVETVDGTKNSERQAKDMAQTLAGDFEFDAFRGMSDFSNAGVFDGSIGAIPTNGKGGMPDMWGLDLQVRASDSMINSQDLMFAEFGSNESVVLSGGGAALTQSLVEDASLRSAIGFGDASSLVVSETVLSGYNKITIGKERIILAGSPQNAVGGDLRKQWTSNGTVNVEASPFLRGKKIPRRPRSNGPAAPVSIAEDSTPAGASGLAAGNYVYYATTSNEIGESPACASVTLTLALNDDAVLTITHPASGVARFFNVYRSGVGGTAAQAKFIGRVRISSGATTTFTDKGNRLPGSSSGLLIQDGAAKMFELCPFSRAKMAMVQLDTREAYFRFATLGVTKPRQFVVLGNLKDEA